MSIPIAYIVTALVGALLGFALGWVAAMATARNRTLNSALRYKNPEAWEMAHCIIAEEDAAKQDKVDTRRMSKNK